LPATGKLFILRPPTVAAVGGFFLSTPPVRGATQDVDVRVISIVFLSTHAPVRGATCKAYCFSRRTVCVMPMADTS